MPCLLCCCCCCCFLALQPLTHPLLTTPWPRQRPGTFGSATSFHEAATADALLLCFFACLILRLDPEPENRDMIRKYTLVPSMYPRWAICSVAREVSPACVHGKKKQLVTAEDRTTFFSFFFFHFPCVQIHCDVPDGGASRLWQTYNYPGLGRFSHPVLDNVSDPVLRSVCLSPSELSSWPHSTVNLHRLACSFGHLFSHSL
jgi:hypothetical protein